MACSAALAGNEGRHLMLRKNRYLIELLTAAGLIVAPFILPYLGFGKVIRQVSDMGL